VITASLAVEDKGLLGEVRSCLEEQHVQMVAEQPQVSDLAPFFDSLAHSSPDLIFLDVGSLREPIPGVIRKIRLAAPDSFLAVLNTRAESTVILDCFHAGANEYLVPPIQEGVGTVCKQLQHASNGRGSKGKSVVFLSAKGGCGASTVACHVAAALTDLNHKVLLADMDIAGGTIDFLMKVHPSYSIMDAFRNTDRLDENYWRGLVSHYEDGLDVVVAPTAIADRCDPAPEQIRRVVEFAQHYYQWTLLDLGHGMSPVTMVAIDAADELCLVVKPRLTALHQAKSVIQTIFDTGYAHERIHLILNNVPRLMSTPPGELEEVLGLPIYASLRDKEDDLEEAFAKGELLHPGNELALQFIHLARKLSGEKVAARRRFSLFGREL